jgi:hypothetical protein
LRHGLVMNDCSTAGAAFAAASLDADLKTLSQLSGVPTAQQITAADPSAC